VRDDITRTGWGPGRWGKDSLLDQFCEFGLIAIGAVTLGGAIILRGGSKT
jgi:hypothetical protein